ncbi:restriction endonuclease subunit S, partial [Empedobacter sp.]|uniref:restriction endonuclease subunit S n=1 Tax=Empedobacter sp. TaxID=1927715 RepID=UPI0028ADC027
KIGTIGRPTLLPNISNFKYTLSANIILIKPKINKLFIYYTLLSEYIENQIQLSIHSTSQPAFGMNKIRSLEIKLPENLSEEFDSIVKPLVKIDDRLNKERELVKKLKTQKQGLMQDLLSGNVRVNY